jgi:hypothetical protein
MHRVQLQFGYNDRLQIYVKEVEEGQKFSEERKTYFSEGIRRLHNSLVAYIRGLHNR